MYRCPNMRLTVHRRIERFVLATLLVCGCLNIQPGSVFAQSTGDAPTTTPITEFREVTPKYKGTIGGALIGAEIGLLIPALLKMEDSVNYIVFPAVFGAGGAVGGYFLLEKNASSATPSIIALSVGIAAVIPTVIATLSLTSNIRSKSKEPVQMLPAQPTPTALFNTGRGLRLGVPAVAVSSSYSKEEITRLHVLPYSEVRLPILSSTF